MAVLTSTGITFSDTTSLNSKYGIFPQLAHVVFFQASAPTGWTQITAHNDKALRVISGTVASGGTAAFSSAFTPKTLSITINTQTLSTPTIPSHAHTSPNLVSVHDPNPPAYFNIGGNGNPNTSTSTSAGGGSHPHAFSPGGATDFDIAYINVISCTFN